MRLYLVRHGETTYNRDGLGLGRDDAPLTDLGLAQADCLESVFHDLQIDRVFASPLQRAAETARRALPGRTPELTDALIELDVGETEGLPFAEMRERYGPVLKEWGGPEGHRIALPGGESLIDVEERVRPFLASLSGEPRAQVALVSHNFVIRVILCHLLGFSVREFRAFATDLASVTIIDVGKHRSALYRLNDTCHLRGLESSPHAS